MPNTPGQPGQRRTARNVGIGAAIGAVVVATGVGVLRDEPAQEPVRAVQQGATGAGELLRDGFEGTGSGGGPVPVLCGPDPLIKPAGFAAVAVTWGKMWSSKRQGAPSVAFPNTPGFPVGIGAGRWEYQLTSFVPPADMTANLFFEPHQARPHEGEPMGRPARGMFLSISPCEGDFRPAGARPWCAILGNTGSLRWTTDPATPIGAPICRLTTETRYYLLVAPVNPTDGIVAGDYLCKDPSAPYCWVQATHRPL